MPCSEDISCLELDDTKTVLEILTYLSPEKMHVEVKVFLNAFYSEKKMKK
jgi:hypothetical protein